MSPTDRKIDTQALAEAFCTWPLPDSVCSDPCATMPGSPHRSGTNLLTVAEAKLMFEHLVERGLISTAAPTVQSGGEIERLTAERDEALYPRIQALADACAHAERRADAAEAREREAVKVLRSVEWVGIEDLADGKYAACCPVCERLEELEPHAPHCRLAAAIRALPIADRPDQSEGGGA